ncbi:MAG TPA: porin, partial [Nannocystis sp.]
MHWAVVCSLLTVPPGPWEPAPAIEVSPPPEAAEATAEPAAAEPAPENSEAAPGPEVAGAATAAAPASEPARESAYEVSPWAPRWEAARMADEPLAGGKARWRPGVGVEVASKNGRFSLAFNAFMQLQAMVLRTPGEPAGPLGAAGPAHTDLTFHFRRARVWLSGNVFTQNIKYRIALTFAPMELGFKDGVPHRTPILDWFFTFDRFRDFTVQVGQYKVPYNLQRMNKITSLQFVDRSLANNEFT